MAFPPGRLGPIGGSSEDNSADKEAAVSLYDSMFIAAAGRGALAQKRGPAWGTNSTHLKSLNRFVTTLTVPKLPI